MVPHVRQVSGDLAAGVVQNGVAEQGERPHAPACARDGAVSHGGKGTVPVDDGRRAAPYPRAMLESADDAVRLVVDTMCFRPYETLGRRSLAQVIRFAPKEQQMIEEAARRLARGIDPGILPRNSAAAPRLRSTEVLRPTVE